MMRGIESWIDVNGDKLASRFWLHEERDVSKPRSDGSRYIGAYYAQLKVDCVLLCPGCKYTFFLKEVSGTIWRQEGTVTQSGLIDCREPPVQYVHAATA